MKFDLEAYLKAKGVAPSAPVEPVVEELSPVVEESVAEEPAAPKSKAKK